MSEIIQPFKFGRLPRKFNSRVPHYSALRMRLGALPTPPAAVDWTTGLAPNWQTMGNDTISDCTAAGIGHAIQDWTAHAQGKELAVSDAAVIQFYSETTGYDPRDPSTDRGGVEQDVLAYALNTGFPMPDGSRSKLLAFIEVDPRNHDDVKRVVHETGGIYIGVDVPAYLVAGPMPMRWDVDPSGDNSSAGGHAVWCPKYDANGIGFVSWGSAAYSMSWRFWDAQVEECYALVDQLWSTAKGTTPLGMSIADLEAQMAAMKEAA